MRRNDAVFCGAPPPTSNSCLLCLYGAERLSHVQRFGAFFDRVAVDVLAPSEAALTLWQARAGLAAASTQLAPHISLTFASGAAGEPVAAPGPVLAEPSAAVGSDLRNDMRCVGDIVAQRMPSVAAPARIAFLGQPADHKGWPVFLRLAALADQAGAPASFHVLGQNGAAAHAWLGPAGGALAHAPVSVTPQRPQAMVEALAAQAIDLAVLWPATLETFSLTAHEALAAGAFIVTHRQSGNVAATVLATVRGVVLDDEAALQRWFATGGATVLAQRARAARADAPVTQQMSAMTLGFSGLAVASAAQATAGRPAAPQLQLAAGAA